DGISQTGELGDDGGEPDQNEAAGKRGRTGGAERRLTERNTESNRGKAARGDHDTQDQQQHRHRPTPRPTRHAEGKPAVSMFQAGSLRTSARRLLWLLNNFDPISNPSAITIVAICLTTWNLLNVQLNRSFATKAS